MLMVKLRLQQACALQTPQVPHVVARVPGAPKVGEVPERLLALHVSLTLCILPVWLVRARLEELG